MRSSALVACVILTTACGTWSVHSSQRMGSLDKEAIRSAIRTHLGEVRDCWQRRVDQGAVHNHLMLELRIVAGGGVERATVVQIAEPDEGLERCFVDHALGWKFPPPSNDGLVIVRYPFALDSEPEAQ